MKKFYISLISVILSAGAISATQAVPANKIVKGEPAEPTSTTQLLKSVPAKRTAAVPMSSPEGEWTKVSTGIWFEGPMAARFSDVNEDQWEVDVYESASTKGWYRVYPYAGTTQLSELIGKTDNIPLDICAVDPAKVYFESWKPYGLTEFRTACPEGGFSNQLYGSMADGVITMENCIAYSNNGGWYILPGSVKLVLDKETYKDYTLEVDVPLCSTASTNAITFNKGADVATIKAVILAGDYPMNEGNATYTSNNGTDVTSYAGTPVNFKLPETNEFYSILYVGLDAAGTVKSSGVKNFFILNDAADQWEDVGNATYTEAILSELFNDVEPEDLICKVERNRTTPGYFRLVEPYTTHSMFGSNAIKCNDHKHYLYINATDPKHVYIEPSVLGIAVNANFGEASAMSWGYLYTDDIEQGETDDVWGTLDGTTITIPKGNIRLAQRAYRGGEFLTPTGTNDFVVKLPAGAITAIEGIDADEAEAPVEYFNLQGMKIDNPAEGQVVIRRQGSKVSKIIR